MATVAALEFELLNLKADKAYYTQQQIHWNKLYEANAAEVTKLQGYEDKWYDAYDDCYYAETDKKVKKNGVEQDPGNVEKARAYADYKMKGKFAYDSTTCADFALLDELCALDIEYDTMKTMYETQLTMTDATIQTVQQQLATAAQDTGVSQSN